MERKNQFIRGDRLSPRRCWLVSQGSSVRVTEGPYSETKEALSGFILFRTENMDEAVQIAKGCPMLLHDKVELIELERE